MDIPGAFAKRPHCGKCRLECPAKLHETTLVVGIVSPLYIPSFDIIQQIVLLEINNNDKNVSVILSNV
jgi:hypothetical protein